MDDRDKKERGDNPGPAEQIEFFECEGGEDIGELLKKAGEDSKYIHNRYLDSSSSTAPGPGISPPVQGEPNADLLLSELEELREELTSKSKKLNAILERLERLEKKVLSPEEHFEYWAHLEEVLNEQQPAKPEKRKLLPRIISRFTG